MLESLTSFLSKYSTLGATVKNLARAIISEAEATQSKQIGAATGRANK